MATNLRSDPITLNSKNSSVDMSKKSAKEENK
jgi:hypothetical protein